MREIHSRLAAIMFVQVTESTENITELPVASCRIEENNDALAIHLKAFRGEILEINSGEIYAYFAGAVSAFNAALSLQAKLPQYNLRIGLHLGEVLQHKRKFLGRDVNLAARLPKLARAGGICLSQSVYQYLEDEAKQILVPIGVHDLKNIDVSIPLYAYLPAGQANRCRRRELKRKVIEKLRRHKWTVWISYLAAVAVIFSLPHVLGLSATDRKVLKIYAAGFEMPSKPGQQNNLYKSIEISVRSLLSGRYENVDIHLLNNRSFAQLELLVRVEHSEGRIYAGYVINALPTGNTVAYGGIEENDSNIFQLQDRLARQILTALPE